MKRISGTALCLFVIITGTAYGWTKYGADDAGGKPAANGANNAVIDGRAYGSINNTIANAAGLTVMITAAQTLTSSLTVPSNVGLMVVRGGSIVKASNYTLIIDGPFQAGNYQVFHGFGLGNPTHENGITTGYGSSDVTFGPGSVKAINPMWWGALGNGVHHDARAMQDAITTGYISHMPVSVPPGKYYLNSTLIANADDVVIIGSGHTNTSIATIGGQTIFDYHGNGTILQLGDPAYDTPGNPQGWTGTKSGWRIENIMFSGGDALKGLAYYQSTEPVLQHLSFANFRNTSSVALWQGAFVQYAKLNDIVVRKNNGNGLFLRGNNGQTSIVHSAFEYNGGYGIRIGSGVAGDASYGVNLFDDSFGYNETNTNTGADLVVNSSDSLFVGGCYFETSYSGQSSKYNVILDPTVSHEYGIVIRDSCFGGGNNADYAVRIGSGLVDDLLFSGNYCVDYRAACIDNRGVDFNSTAQYIYAPDNSWNGRLFSNATLVNGVMAYSGDGESGGKIPDVSAVDLSGRTADISSTDLIAAPIAGKYRISIYTNVEAAATASSTLPAVNITYTDKGSGATVTIPATATNNGNIPGTEADAVRFIDVQAGKPITYSTSGYGSSGAAAMKYGLHIALEALN